jgi:hypothetical protein
MSTSHTPTPWVADGHYIHGPDELRFLAVAGDRAGVTPEANAAFIVRACNSHDELLHHLRILAEEDSQCAPDWVAKKSAARAAIARAETP